ncbi:MAG: hypothetical protein ABSG30_17520 [Steroidobacteraceae bacterium]|jgi:hypothetical protein
MSTARDAANNAAIVALPLQIIPGTVTVSKISPMAEYSTVSTWHNIFEPGEIAGVLSRRR